MFPRFSGRYCELFLGSGIILLSYLKEHPEAECIGNDLCLPLIELWKACRDRPEELAKDYREMWTEYNLKDSQWRKEVFARIRNEFNEDQTRASRFLFLTRTAINGLVRFNSNGQYNSPPHFTRPGLDPSRMTKLLNECSTLIRNVDSRCGSYEDVHLNENDFCYMDPPYAMTGSSMYLGGFNNEKYYEYVEKLPCKWLMSYDGLANGNIVAELPSHLWKSHWLSSPTMSPSFNALYGADGRRRVVQESLYGSFEPEVEQEPTIDIFC